MVYLMKSRKWYPREDIQLARKQLAEYLFNKLTSGQRLDEAIFELLETLKAGTAEPGVQALAYRCQHRYSARHFVTASAVKRWFYEAIPNPRQRIRQLALEMVHAGADIHDTAKMLNVSVRSLRRLSR